MVMTAILVLFGDHAIAVTLQAPSLHKKKYLYLIYNVQYCSDISEPSNMLIMH